MNRIRLQFALGLLFVATCSRGQQNVPPAVRGEMPPATSESGLKNVLTGGFSVTSSYDDNALSTVDNHSSDTQFNIAPHIGIQQSRRHFNWSADYAPGFAFSRRFDNRDELTQAVGGGFQFQPTARWSLWARENFTVTTDPFQQLAQDAFLPDLAPSNGPNPSIVAPLAKRTGKVSSAGASYRWSAHTSIGLNAGFSQLDYDNLSSDSTTPLLNSQSASGGLFISHQLSKTQTVGVQYSFAELQFAQLGSSHTITHSVQLFDQFQFSPRSSLYFFVGPEYARSAFNAQFLIAQQIIQFPLRSSSWSPAAGAIYTFRSQRGSLQISYTRRVSDGGGLGTAVHMDDVSGEFRRTLTPRWTAGIGAGYAINSVANAAAPDSGLNSISSFAELQRQLAKNLTLRFSYSLLRQDGSLLGQVQGDHNRAVVSLEYSFARPLGF